MAKDVVMWQCLCSRIVHIPFRAPGDMMPVPSPRLERRRRNARPGTFRYLLYALRSFAVALVALAIAIIAAGSASAEEPFQTCGYDHATVTTLVRQIYAIGDTAHFDWVITPGNELNQFCIVTLPK